MKKKDMIINAKKAIDKLEYKKNQFIYHRYTKYIVDYRIEGDCIRVFSNLGVSRKIKNTHSNMNKINRTIIKNKVEIANRIDEYENNSNDRSLVLLINMFLLCASGAMVVLTLFIGSYMLFLLSIILFSLSVLASSIMGLNYYIKVKEIQNLKQITGYKMENEFKLPHIDLSSIKTR